MEGYVTFSEQYYESKMSQSLKNISAVLSKREMDELGWQEFDGTVLEYRATRNRIMDGNGNLREEFLGMEGYANFAEKYYESRMHLAFVNASAFLSKREMDELGWQVFQGTAADYHSTISRVMDDNGNPREEILGMDGLATLADQYYESNMLKSFKKYFCCFGREEGNETIGAWVESVFWSSSQYHELIDFFRTTDRELLKGFEGQKLTANIVFEGHTISTYKNVSTLRETLLGDRKEFTRLGWIEEDFKEGKNMDKYFKILFYIACSAFVCAAPLAQEAFQGRPVLTLFPTSRETVFGPNFWIKTAVQRGI